MSISKKQWLAVAREATAGTAQPIPTLYVPGKAKFKNKKKRIYTPEDRGTRDANYNVVDGVRHSEGDLSGNWYNDVSPYLLLAFMGADAASQPNVGSAPTVWLHNLTLTDSPLPLDFWKSYDALVYSLTYHAVHKLKFKWSAADKALEYTANTEGHAFTKLTPAPNAPTLATAGTGGTVAAGVYTVVVSYVTASGEGIASQTATVTGVGATSTITITSPSAGQGATGWYAYVSQANGSTLTRQQAAGSPTAIGTNLVLTAPPTSSGVAPLQLNPTYSTLLPFAGYTPVIQLNGTQSQDIEEMEIELEQKIELWYPSANSQDFATIYYGERTAKINYTARFDNDANFSKYLTTPAPDDHINVTFTGPIIASTYAQQLVFDFPIVGYDDIEMDDSKANIKIKAKATARPGATPNSLFTAQVQNTVTSYAA